MNARIDITHERYGRLVALERVATVGRSRSVWKFQCDCGRVVDRIIDGVRSGVTKSCGCLRAEVTGKRSFRHGHKRSGKIGSKTLRAYEKAKARCYNPNDSRFSTYGARGITMCEEWRNSFTAFLADMGECPNDLTLGRIDNDKGYEPGNCRWETRKQQARNKTNNVWVEYKGERMILADLATVSGFEYRKLRHLVRTRGMTGEDAVSHLQNL